jgi:hypothetical protein
MFTAALSGTTRVGVGATLIRRLGATHDDASAIVNVAAAMGTRRVTI